MATEFETVKDCSSRQSFSVLFGWVDMKRVCRLYWVFTKAQATPQLRVSDAYQPLFAGKYFGF
jgi:hypothetical protein